MSTHDAIPGRDPAGIGMTTGAAASGAISAAAASASTGSANAVSAGVGSPGMVPAASASARHDAALVAHGQHVMTVCNACRYCEQYCPVFPAMERRLVFTADDLAYLANLCHNCGECLYACQYAPPHPFAINVPRALAELRVDSYERYAWPQPLAGLFARHGGVTSVALTALFSLVLFAGTRLLGNGRHGATASEARTADFYAVISHDVMVGLFGAVGLFVLVAMSLGLFRFWRDIAATGPATPSAAAPVTLATIATAFRDAATLRHLHSSGPDCTTAEEDRTPWRRWWHHATLYGFLLCFASTTVAAIYHSVFGWHAPYGYTSLPVILGTIGGLGLIAGPIGLLAIRRRRDPALGDPAQGGLDVGFITLLLIVSATGLALLGWRTTAAMPLLLIVHLGAVLALFVTLPYGKFVHGFYRVAALIKSAAEGRDA